VLEWDHLIRCTIDTAGVWKINFASYGLYTSHDWDAVWNEQFQELLPGRAHLSDSDFSKNNKAFLQAQEIVIGQLWDASVNGSTVTSK
jgi:hypothetical protein